MTSSPKTGLNDAGHLVRRWLLKIRARRLVRSPLFDSNWYKRQYPDVSKAGIEPALHYVARGAAEKRAPHPLFSPSWFCRHAEVAAADGRTPLEYYLSLPPRQRPSPQPLFNPDWYLAFGSEAIDDSVDPFEHFVRSGGQAGRSPHPQFDAAWYLASYPDVAKAGLNPLVHYLSSGHREGRDPSPWFSTSAYLDANPDVARAGIPALWHYVVSGKSEGRSRDPAADLLLNQQSPTNVSLGTRLRWRPQPLLDGVRRTAVSWSAKSACTHVLIWHLERLGLLDQAESFSPWPHDFRTQVLVSSQLHQEACLRLATEGPGQWTYVKVVRDPARRCIASFRHALKHGYEDRLMSCVLGRAIDHRLGFSYRAFLEYLSKINLARCNVHHRLQSHPLDRLHFSRFYLILIDDQNLESWLQRIDADQGRDPATSAERRRRSIERAAHRHAPDDPEAATDPKLWQKPLNHDQAISDWPKSGLQACREATAIARKLYAADYAMLGELRQRSISRD